MTIRRIVRTAILTLLVALAVASPASAEHHGDGAEVANDSYCVTASFGTACYDFRYVWHEVQTPSGNYSFMWNGRWSVEFTGSGVLAGCNTSHSEDRRSHALVKDYMTVHEQSNRSVYEYTIQCLGGTNVTCTSKAYVHYANGEFQFNQRELVCIHA